MHQIGLSLEILNQIEYHWLWGLVLTKNKSVSLGNDVSEILKEMDEKGQSQKIIQIENEFNRFIHLSFFYRNILWLLSSSTRQNYYLRSAVRSHFIYEYPWHHSSDYKAYILTEKHEQALSQGYLFIENCPKEYIHFNQMIMMLIKNVENIFSNDSLQQTKNNKKEFLAKSAQKNMKILNSDVRPEDTFVKVTPSIQKPLQVLDLNYQNGESISLSSISKAFKQKALKTHPDKNNAKDTGQQFIQIKEAYNTILKSIQNSPSYHSDVALVNQLLSELEEHYQKIKLKVEAFLAEAEECIAETKIIQAQARAYLAEGNAGLFNHPPEVIEEQSNTDLTFH